MPGSTRVHILVLMVFSIMAILVGFTFTRLGIDGGLGTPAIIIGVGALLWVPLFFRIEGDR